MQKYFEINRTATRSEFWAANLIGGIATGLVAALSVVLIGLGLDNSDFLLGLGAILLAVDLIAAYWFSVATSIRRCNDAKISPWWAAAVCLPYVGSVVFIVIGCLKTENA
jgi:uncharacterized membrane protein YhaH (DUF805 family)